MQLFGFCERSFNGSLAPGVDAFAAACLRKRVRLLQCTCHTWRVTCLLPEWAEKHFARLGQSLHVLDSLQYSR